MTDMHLERVRVGALAKRLSYSLRTFSILSLTGKIVLPDRHFVGTATLASGSAAFGECLWHIK
jgi:hypothetical protein